MNALLLEKPLDVRGGQHLALCGIFWSCAVLLVTLSTHIRHALPRVLCTQNASHQPKACCMRSFLFLRIHILGCLSPTLIVLLATISRWLTRVLSHTQATGGHFTFPFSFFISLLRLFILPLYSQTRPFSVRPGVAGVGADEVFNMYYLKRFSSTI